ncbi:hypothetical protein [Pseudobacillus badius]|uniref:hypothetical protein n=1 Tax=Bacillus badius TaxID=1455 RepID=UPI0007B3E829|nr:hypothetical protein [Bacillus badius]KZR59998.1 hypothetical protein A3781_07285 [Bacillus badius]
MAIIDLCEACKRNKMNVIEASDEPNSLINYVINVILAVVHSPNKFLLHDGFYEEDVIVTEEDKAPTLRDVRNDLEPLLDFSITRWFLEEDVIKKYVSKSNICRQCSNGKLPWHS